MNRNDHVPIFANVETYLAPHRQLYYSYIYGRPNIARAGPYVWPRPAPLKFRGWVRPPCREYDQANRVEASDAGCWAHGFFNRERWKIKTLI